MTQSLAPLYFSDYFEVRPSVLNKYGAFNVSIVSDLPLFDCADDGVISIVFNQVEFNGPQDFASLLGHLRKRRERFSAIRTLIEAEVIAEGAFGTG